MIFSSTSRPNAPALLAIIVLHAGLFSMLLAQRYQTVAQHEGKLPEPVQWLLPLTMPQAVKAAMPDEPKPQRAAAPRARLEARPQPVSAPPTQHTAEPATASAAAPASDPFDLPPAPARPATETQLRRNDWGAGKADHDLRGGKLARLVRPTDTLQAGLERAFQEAGEAVPPKWFSAPEIREISVPDGRTRMYKIRTAFVTYCFYKPDPSLEANYDYKLMTCPREK